MIFLLSFFVSVASAQEFCQTTTKEIPTEEVTVSNAEVPTYLVGAKITVKTKDGIVYDMPIEHFKVVPRNQVNVVIKTNTVTTTQCKADEKLNNLSVGVRQGHTTLTKDIQPGSVTLKSVRGPIFDVEYYRRNVLNSVGFGAGIDSNGDPKIKIGGDF